MISQRNVGFERVAPFCGECNCGYPGVLDNPPATSR